MYSEKIPSIVVRFDILKIVRVVYLGTFITLASGVFLFWGRSSIVNPDLILENFVFSSIYNFTGVWGFFKTYQFAQEGEIGKAALGVIVLIFFSWYGILWFSGRVITI